MSSSQDNKPTRRRRNKKADIEHQIQVSQIAWTEWQGIAWPELRAIYAVPNQGKRSAQGYSRMINEGLKTGQWDLCLPVPKRGFGALYIENKIPDDKKSKLSAKQIERGKILTEVGNLCYVLRSYDDFVALVTWYLGHEDPMHYAVFTQGELWEFEHGDELPY